MSIVRPTIELVFVYHFFKIVFKKKLIKIIEFFYLKETQHFYCSWFFLSICFVCILWCCLHPNMTEHWNKRLICELVNLYMKLKLLIAKVEKNCYNRIITISGSELSHCSGLVSKKSWMRSTVCNVLHVNFLICCQ